MTTFRTFLIVAATVLASVTAVAAYRLPIKVNMRWLAMGLFAAGSFFTVFFLVTRLIDNYGWWLIPTLAFSLAGGIAWGKCSAINRLIEREKLSPWLASVISAASQPATGATARSDMTEWDESFATLIEPGEEEPRPRRFLDDFAIADEADLGPQGLELARLDNFIFTARHGYLVHDVNRDRAPCDVMTIFPGMSIADLIDAARLHQCAKEKKAAA